MSNTGVYVLWLYLPQTMSIGIGKLGTFQFDRGVYAYAGRLSAICSRGLPGIAAWRKSSIGISITFGLRPIFWAQPHFLISQSLRNAC